MPLLSVFARSLFPSIRVLEHGVRAPVLYRYLREQMGETGFPQKVYRKFALFLHSSIKISGNLRDNVI